LYQNDIFLCSLVPLIYKQFALTPLRKTGRVISLSLKRSESKVIGYQWKRGQVWRDKGQTKKQTKQCQWQWESGREQLFPTLSCNHKSALYSRLYKRAIETIYIELHYAHRSPKLSHVGVRVFIEITWPQTSVLSLSPTEPALNECFEWRPPSDPWLFCFQGLLAMPVTIVPNGPASDSVNGDWISDKVIFATFLYLLMHLIHTHFFYLYIDVLIVFYRCLLCWCVNKKSSAGRCCC